MPLDSTTYVEHDVIPDILRRTRHLVADGWVQLPSPPGDGHCIIGAVGATIRAMESETGRPLMGLFNSVLDRLELGLPSGVKRGALTLALYNDQPGRTLEDILNLFDKAMVGNEMPV